MLIKKKLQSGKFAFLWYTHQDLDGGEYEDCVEAFDVRVRDESTNQGEDADCTIQVSGSGGGIGDAHMHRAMQVAHYVQQHWNVSNVCHHNKDCKREWVDRLINMICNLYLLTCIFFDYCVKM